MIIDQYFFLSYNNLENIDDLANIKHLTTLNTLTISFK